MCIVGGIQLLTTRSELIGDAENQARLVAAWARLTSRLAELSDEIEERKQDVTMAPELYRHR